MIVKNAKEQLKKDIHNTKTIIYEIFNLSIFI